MVREGQVSNNKLTKIVDSNRVMKVIKVIQRLISL